MKSRLFYVRHGKSKLSEYQSVKGHYHYIFTPTHVAYPWYKNMPFYDKWNPTKGGSFGIAVDWIIKNIGKRPGKGWSLDIIRHEKGFVPGNLRWAQRLQQKRNQRQRFLGQLTNKEFKIEAKRRGFRIVKSRTTKSG